MFFDSLIAILLQIVCVFLLNFAFFGFIDIAWLDLAWWWWWRLRRRHFALLFSVQIFESFFFFLGCDLDLRQFCCGIQTLWGKFIQNNSFLKNFYSDLSKINAVHQCVFRCFVSTHFWMIFRETLAYPQF